MATGSVTLIHTLAITGLEAPLYALPDEGLLIWFDHYLSRVDCCGEGGFGAVLAAPFFNYLDMSLAVVDISLTASQNVEKD